MCDSSGEEAARRQKPRSKRRPRAERERVPAGKAGLDRDGRTELPPGCHSARVPGAPRGRISMNVITAGPSYYPPRGLLGEGCAASSQAGCACSPPPPPRSRRLMAASLGGRSAAVRRPLITERTNGGHPLSRQ